MYPKRSINVYSRASVQGFLHMSTTFNEWLGIFQWFYCLIIALHFTTVLRATIVALVSSCCLISFEFHAIVARNRWCVYLLPIVESNLRSGNFAIHTLQLISNVWLCATSCLVYGTLSGVCGEPEIFTPKSATLHEFLDSSCWRTICSIVRADWHQTETEWQPLTMLLL